MSDKKRILAIKYRPQKLQEIVGQDHIVNLIKNSIQEDNLPPTLLLSGIRGTGKTSLARIIAKILNCIKKGTDACGSCESCIAIQNGNHLDVLEIDAASHTGVDNIREIIESAKYMAVQGKYKVFIIDEAHMLSKSAFNALLKNLEEPYEHVFYILATTDLHKIPDTVLSRCMRLNLALFNTSNLKGYIRKVSQEEKFHIDENVLEEIAFAADGSLRDALTILNQAMLMSHNNLINKESLQHLIGFTDRTKNVALLENLFEGNVEESLSILRGLLSQGADPLILLQNLLDLVYWLTCLKQTPQLLEDDSFPESLKISGKELAEKLTMPKVLHAWQVLNKGYVEYQESPLKHQTLEMILIKFCFVLELPALEAFDKKKTSKLLNNS